MEYLLWLQLLWSSLILLLQSWFINIDVLFHITTITINYYSHCTPPVISVFCCWHQYYHHHQHPERLLFFRSFLYRCEWHKVFYWWATYKQLALLSTFSFFNEVKVTYIPIIEGVGMIFEILFIWPTLWPICHTARDLLVANTSGENSHHREDIDFLKQIMPQKLKLIGGFSIEIKAKISYLIICCYHNNVLCIYDNHISRDIMFRF